MGRFVERMFQSKRISSAGSSWQEGTGLFELDKEENVCSRAEAQQVYGGNEIMNEWLCKEPGF